MQIDFAPMEGVTDYIFRKIFNDYFKGVSRYYTPFLSPMPKRILAPKEFREVDPKNNDKINLIPQILTNNANDFSLAAEMLYDMGYETINLNLGCPSGTVTAKGKGSGFLKYPEELEIFLGEIFKGNKYKISIKTRIGVEREEEWDEILEIYKKFPISELIVHPRLMKEQYRGNVHISAYEKAYNIFSSKITYNGDIKKKGDIDKIIEQFPKTEKIMLGRGLIGNPYLAEEVSGNKLSDKKAIKEFARDLYKAYADEFQSEHAAVNRMKGIWFYLLNSFEAINKNTKLIKKASNAIQLESAVMQIR